MMKLYELFVRLGKLIMEVHEGTSTAIGTTTTLVDTNSVFHSDFYQDGTLILDHATYGGAYRVAGNNTAGVITFSPALAAACPTATPYAIMPKTFTLVEMRQAVNWILESTKYMLTDITLQGDGSTEEFTLPSGVTHDVRRVEIAQNTSAPYNWYRHQAWEIVNGSLVFLQKPPGSNIIRVHYAGYHEPLDDDDDDVPITIDTQHLLWASAAYLYRKLYDRTKEDNPEKTNLLNEARIKEEAAKNAGGPFLLPRDPIVWRAV